MIQPDRRALMTALGDELADVRTLVDELAILMSDLIVRCPAEMRPEALARAQAFDPAIQRLDALGGLMAALGAGLPLETALHAVTLSGMADRLAGRAPVAPVPAGDLVLFD
jgi:hypothetical protein